MSAERGKGGGGRDGRERGRRILYSVVTKRLQVRPPTSNFDANDLSLRWPRFSFFCPLVSFGPFLARPRGSRPAASRRPHSYFVVAHARTRTRRTLVLFGIRETSSRAVIFDVISVKRVILIFPRGPNKFGGSVYPLSGHRTVMRRIHRGVRSIVLGGY